MTASALGFDAVVELAKRTKLALCRSWRPGLDDDAVDLTTHVVAVRDGSNVALVYAGPSGPTGGRRATYLAAAFLRPDELYVVADTVTTVSARLTRAEAEAVVPGSLVEAWRAGARDGLTECLVVQRLGRSGGLEAWSLPYTRLGSAVTWGPAEHMDVPIGAIVDHARAGFAAGDDFWNGPNGAAIMASAAGLSPAEAQWHTDRACARAASAHDHGSVVLLGPTLCRFTDGAEVPAL